MKYEKEMESKDKQERRSDCGEYVVASVEIPAQVSTTGLAAAVAAVGDAADYVFAEGYAAGRGYRLWRTMVFAGRWFGWLKGPGL